MCHNTTTHQNYESTEEECEAAGNMRMGEEHHETACHNTTTHQNYESTEEECEAAGHIWMGEEHHDLQLPEIHADYVAHALSFPAEEGNHSDGDEDHEAGYAVIHIEEEGDYGLQSPRVSTSHNNGCTQGIRVGRCVRDCGQHHHGLCKPWQGRVHSLMRTLR